MNSSLAPDFLQILACPNCKGELHQSEDGSTLQCTPCSRDFPVIEGVPLLLPDQGVAANLTEG
jgi:uncharacterized protein YbaR (Trm112 family)